MRDGTDPKPYRVLAGAERDKIIIDLLKRIDARDFSMVGTGRARWDKGWQENLDALRETGDLAALQPKYIRTGQPLRMDGEFIIPDDPNYHATWYEAFRKKFCDLLEPYDHIYELGSGSGFNVAYMAQRWPNKRIVGLDWSLPAIEILHTLYAKHGLNVEGHHFDFFHPDRGMTIPPKSAFLTVCALEQTGKGWQPLFEFMADQKPAFCLHIEPLLDLYDRESLVDYTAIRAHEVRNYWSGLMEKIDDYAFWSDYVRTGFGSLLVEGYSQLMWQPRYR